MSAKHLSRRQFLKTSGLVVGGAAVAGATGAWLAPSGRAWALGTKALDPHAFATLVAMCRALFPHRRIADADYAKGVEELDAKAAEDPKLARMLAEGVAALDREAGGKWLEASDGAKLEALEGAETTPFFQAVRGAVVGPSGPYNQPTVWKQFGYEGSSWQRGGYLKRGFDDIAWLPKE